MQNAKSASSMQPLEEKACCFMHFPWQKGFVLVLVLTFFPDSFKIFASCKSAFLA